MKLNLREIIQNACMLGVFIGFLFIDSNIGLGAAISLGCIAIFFLLEKGIL